MFLELLDEAYFKKSKKLLEMEKAISDIRSAYMGDIGNELIGARSPGKIETSREWIKLKTLIEEQFGFYSVNLVLDRTTLPNAYTLPITCTFDGSFEASKAFYTDNTGFKYKPEYRYCTLIGITEGMMFHKDLSPGEILSILLHEIGHNFDTTCFTHLPPLTAVLMVLEVIESLKIGVMKMKPDLILNALVTLFTSTVNTRRVASKGLDKIIQGELWCIYDCFQAIMMIPRDLLTKLIFIPLGTIMAPIQGILTAIATSGAIPYINWIYGYSKENYSDKFASMHGYGPELVSAMNKSFRKPLGSETVIGSIPIIGHLYGLYGIFFTMMSGLFDTHPVPSARIEACVSIIEHDLSDSRLDKKTKDQIRKDISKIRAECARFDKEVEDSTMYSVKVKTAYDNLLMKSLPGFGDLRSKFGQEFLSAKVIDAGIANAGKDIIDRTKIR